PASPPPFATRVRRTLARLLAAPTSSLRNCSPVLRHRAGIPTGNSTSSRCSPVVCPYIYGADGFGCKFVLLLQRFCSYCTSFLLGFVLMKLLLSHTAVPSDAR